MAIATQPAKAPAADLAEGLSGPAASPTTSIVAGNAPIAIPQASLLFDADFVRSGDDLTLVGHDGQELLIVDYFGAGAPDLIAPNHAMLDGQTVTLLAGPQFPGQYAQAGGATQPAEPIGSVETLQGAVTAQRADGTTHELKVGDPVFESDVVTTGPGSNIGMKLADGTLVTLQESGKLAINEFVYQADGADNSALLNVIQGTFSLFAGQVAPTGDMQIKTPIATMGIRGTSILGVNVDAILGRLSLTQDPDGHVGFIEIFNNQNGNLFTVLRTVFEKITVSESGLLSLTPKTPEELGIDQTLTELLHDFYQQVPRQGPDETPRPQSGPNRFETPNIQEILFAPTPPQGGEELLLPQELLEQFLESLLEIQEIRDEIILALTQPAAGQIVLDDQLEGSDAGAGAGEGGGTIETTLPFQFGSSGPGSVGFASLDGQPVVDANGDSITSGGPGAGAGQQLVYAWDPAENTLTAVDPGEGGEPDETIFTIEVDPTTGEVKVTINGAVDHLGENDEFLSINIPFTVQAANGQTATGTLTVVVSDDVPVIGDLRGIEEAGSDNSGLEPAAALLNQTVEDALNTLPGNPGDLTDVLDTVQAQVGDLAKAIAVVWDFLDDVYVTAGPNQGNINEAFVRLGVAYAEYIQNNGVPLTDVTAKFTPDGGDGNDDPERLQSLHDNLLGNLGQGPLNSRFPEQLRTELENLIKNVDPDLLNRPTYSGNEGSDPSAARQWDLDNGFAPPQQGVVDEDDLSDGSDAAKEPVCITRELAIDWGADDGDNDALEGATGDRTLKFEDALDGATPGGLKSNGEQITYSLSEGGTVLTASTCNGTVFTVSLNDDGSGSYTFTLEGNLDHSGVGEDNLFLDFGIVATDADLDSATGSFSVAVTDDAPAPGWFNQDFEAATDAASAGLSDATNGWSGGVAVHASGFNGIVTPDGGDFAILTQSDGAGGLTGPFTRFAGYKTEFNGGFCASVAIYLDTGWSAGEGFDYSVAANGQDNAHLQDFIFHVTRDTSTGKLLVSGSNNTSFDPREDLETVNNVEVEDSGWYTFEHVFRDNGDGTLAVDLNLYDSDGNLLFTETRHDPANILATEVGGNRYGWFTNIDIAAGIAVDDLTLAPLSLVNEDDLAQEPLTVAGDLAIDWGADDGDAVADGAVQDAPGGAGNRSLTFDALDGAPARLTSNGEQIVYTLSEGGTVLTASANGETVFSVTLDDDGSGSYTFTLEGNLDHQDESAEQLLLDFDFIATDSDGDTASGSFSVAVTDDAPVAKGDLWGLKEAGPDGDLKPAGALLTQAVNNALDTLPGNPCGLTNVLSTVRGEVGGLAAAIVVVWDFLDDAYVLAASGQVDINKANINEAFVRLGVEYANYVKDGGAPLTDVTAKFTGDNDYSGYPDRVQSLHDNLLGNLTTAALDQRFGEDSPHYDPETLSALTTLINGVDEDLLNRPYYSGNEGTDPSAARQWDSDNGFASQQEGGFHGNVLINDDLGADGPGAVSSIVIDGVTYRFDGETITFDDEQPILTEFGEGSLAFASGKSLFVQTEVGGLFAFHFGAGELDGAPNEPGESFGEMQISAGDWHYLPPNFFNDGETDDSALPYENFRYTITDADGDSSTASLTIVVDPERIEDVILGDAGDNILGADPNPNLNGLVDGQSEWSQGGSDAQGYLSDNYYAPPGDLLVGGLGKDTFVLDNFAVTDFIADYEIGEEDVIDLSALLDGVTADNYESFVRIDDQGDGAVDVLQVNTGDEDKPNFVDVAKLNGDAGVDIIVNDGSTQHVTNPDHIA